MDINRNYSDLKKFGITDEEDILTKARNHYEKMPRKKRAMIFNSLIIERYFQFSRNERSVTKGFGTSFNFIHVLSRKK